MLSAQNRAYPHKTSTKKQKKVIFFGEEDTEMYKTSQLKMILTMLTNKAVGE